ncbi:MAG: S-methyl-5-thioribose-1-phosphate isomerase [Deltaproteobacteria bacterium]|nr:MAG: S-methyl-5-thioribose-1-phosphate isomerase [Deltaproteobacteria bacterium]
MIPTIVWQEKKVKMVDQRRLPHRVEWYVCRSYKDVIRAIKGMVIRGAPAIGIAAAMGLVLGAHSIRTKSYDTFIKRLSRISDEILSSRPTAVNLKWALDRMMKLAYKMSQSPVIEIKEALYKESQKILDEDIEMNRKIGKNGERLVPDGAVILTHCNAGSLATGGYGTALGVIRAAHEAGKKIRVIADETRPWLQGLRLTVFELMQDGIPVSAIADNAAGYLMKRGEVDLVITGADRIAANGDVANKIGTYQLAVLAKEIGIPFYVAAPTSTIDPSIERGEMIPVEYRSADEVLKIRGSYIGPKDADAINPVFDITPSSYISAIITEKGVIERPHERGVII